MKTEPVKFEFSTKVFETIDQLLLDVECKKYTSQLISEIKMKRALRVLPPPGMKYVRGPYEQLTESNRLTSEFMIAEYPALVAKKSILSSTIRLFIGEVISQSLQKTYNHYRITLEKGVVFTEIVY
jgi:endoglucanase Acf2